MERWYEVSGQYNDGWKIYGKTYLVFASSSSDAEQKIFHLRFPQGHSFFPCSVNELNKNIIYEY